MQVPDERRECDVEDGVVDIDDQRRQAHDGQGQAMSVPVTRQRAVDLGEQAHRPSPAAGAPSGQGQRSSGGREGVAAVVGDDLCGAHRLFHLRHHNIETSRPRRRKLLPQISPIARAESAPRSGRPLRGVRNTRKMGAPPMRTASHCVACCRAQCDTWRLPVGSGLSPPLHRQRGGLCQTASPDGVHDALALAVPLDKLPVDPP